MLRNLGFPILILMNAGLGVALPIIISLHYALSFVEQFVLGSFVFTSLGISEIIYYVRSINLRGERAETIERIRDAFDMKLHNIQASFRELDIRNPTYDVRYAYFHRAAERLESELSAVCGSGELVVDSEHLYLADVVLQAFSGNETDLFRTVHKVEYNAHLLETHEAQWLRRIHTGVENGKIKGVRRLFLLPDSIDDIEDDVSLKLISAHHNTPRYDYRLLKHNAFRRLIREYKLDTDVIDFGIYGSFVLYKALSYGEDSVQSGKYVMDSAEIEKYIGFHDQCWTEGRKLQNNSIIRGLNMKRVLSG